MNEDVYVGGDEILIFIASLAVAMFFLVRWYKYVCKAGGINGRKRLVKLVLAFLPAAALTLIIITLDNWAASDVVGFYFFSYTIIGLAWIYPALVFLSLILDLSWIDDILSLNNKAALIAFVGAFVAITLIYCGANIGEGPGWWCVFFAGGLGTILWFALAIALAAFTDLPHRITAARDIGGGIRFGFYLFSIGLSLARASGGDWLSFGATITDFVYAWPALAVAVFAIITERLIILASNYRNNGEYRLAEHRDARMSNGIFGSVFLGLIYVAMVTAPIIYLLPPLL